MGNGCYRRTQLFGAGHPAKQVVIKLAAADAVTDHFTVVVLHRVLAHHADAEAANGLQGAAIAILGGINIQAGQYSGGYPACAGFIPGEFGLVRSEERRVGKECRARWALYHEKKSS